MYSTSNGVYGGWNGNLGMTPNSFNNHIVAEYQQPSVSSNPYYNSQNQFPISSYPKSQNPQYLGLSNLGNTCYMSSVLQAIFDVLIINPKSISSYHQPITYLYTQLQQTHNDRDYTEFKKHLGNKLDFVATYQQQDAHEFLTNLLEILNRENQHTEGKKVNFVVNKECSVVQNWGLFCDQMRKGDNSEIIDLFGGQLYTELRCHKNHSQYLFERFLHLSISLPSNSPQVFHLQRLLTTNFQQQTLDGVTCQYCNTKTRKNKKSVIYNPPRIFVIHLKRFQQGFWSNIKINAAIAYNQVLDLKQEYIHPDTRTLNESYDLYAVIHHIGTMNGGHYVTEKKVGGKWFLCDDLKVRETKVMEKDNVSETAYVLFYRRR